MTSRPACSSVNLSRSTLARLFWEAKVMQIMQTGDHVVHAHYIPPISISRAMFGDGPPEPIKFDDNLVTFVLWTFRIDQEPWAAIVCDGRTIIPPFPFFGYEHLPLTPEAIPRV